MNLRNVAIIAHVDHGKTTLVDGLLKQSKVFRENESMMTQELIMDSNDQERERGITILAKNTAVIYRQVGDDKNPENVVETKINIVDTPGHADFSGEVERTLNMADGAILLVDAQEGPMPQTKFVLRKALELGLKIIVVINKIDKKDAHIDNTMNKVYDLFLELAADENQLDFPILYAIGRDGKAWNELPENNEEPADLIPIFEAILKYVPTPKANIDEPFQMLVSSLDWDSHKGKYAIGKINRGTLKATEKIVLMKDGAKNEEITIDKIYVNQGLSRVEVAEAPSGEIVAVTGIKNADIGDTLADINNPEAMPATKIGAPTLSITIGANTSPFKGTEGSLLTSRQILERIKKELQTNVAMKFEIDENGQYIISGRGELHLCVFLETLSREGFELEIAKPKVITQIIDGVEMEPVEEYSVDVSNEYTGPITAEFSKRKGVLIGHEETIPGYSRLLFDLRTRSTLGLRSILLSVSKGTAVVNSSFSRYEKVSNDSRKIRKGVLIASETGKAVTYGLRNAQERGSTFIDHSTPVYQGMVIGLNVRDSDLEINVCKGKQLTNMRSKGEDTIFLSPPIKMSLEECFGFIEDDELLEITPKNLRIRKKILDSSQRYKSERSKNS